MQEEEKVGESRIARPLALFRSKTSVWLLSALLLLVLSAVLGALLVDRLQKQQQMRQAELEAWSTQVAMLIEKRFRVRETRVEAAAALFEYAGGISRGQWREFTQRVNPDPLLTDMLGMAWVPRISEDALPELLERLRSEGFADPGRDLAPGRGVYCPIVYNEPLKNRESSIGLDICARPVLHRAAERARTTGGAVLSDKFVIAPDPEQPVFGFSIISWIDDPQPSWVALAISVEVLFGRLDFPDGIAMQVLHNGADSRSRLVYANGPFPEADYRLQSARRLSLGGQEFEILQRAVVRHDANIYISAFLGLALALLLTWLIHHALMTRMRAEADVETATAAYRDSEDLLQSVTSNIAEGIYRGVPGQGLLYINQALVDMFGFADAQDMMAGTGPILYASPSVRRRLFELIDEHGGYRNEEVEFVRLDGSHFHALNSAVATRDENGQVLYFDGVILDISERKRAEQALQRLAHYDALTDLPNRTLLHDRINQSITHSRRHDRSVAIMFMDLDRFKSVNDSLGHAIGDLLLVAVSERLQQFFRAYDTISRVGGDEFVVVMPGASAEVAARKAWALIESFDEPFNIKGHTLIVTPSVGIAMYPQDGHDAEELLRSADNAMYHAKERGRATFEFVTAELKQHASERLELETQLRGALLRKELSLVFQPILETASGKICGAEALLRWHHPELGQVSPQRFIPVAEHSGLMFDIGRWVIRAACQQLAAWQAQGLDTLTMSVNVSAVQLWRDDLAMVIAEALEACGLSGEQLQIELTENMLMGDVVRAREVLAGLKKLGVVLAIDDFGTGYSSLSYLKQFRIDCLKIDKSFVRDLAADSEDAAIVSAVLVMAERLRLQVVAEGVETKEQLAYLQKQQCDYLQGFYFSRPLPPDQFLRLVQAGQPD